MSDYAADIERAGKEAHAAYLQEHAEAKRRDYEANKYSFDRLEQVLNRGRF
jgi:hypothetical protein